MRRLTALTIWLLFFLPLIAGAGWYYAGGAVNNPASWDLLEDECDNITANWTSDDQVPAVSEVDPAGQFRFDTNAGAAGNDHAGRYRDIGSYPNTFTDEIKIYHDNIGTYANSDHFFHTCRQADEALHVYFSSNGLFLRDTDSGYTEIGTGLVKEGGSAEWQTWRFLVTFTGVTGEGTCDVYLNDSTHNWEQVGSANCSWEVGNEGLTTLYQKGDTTDNMTSHVDYIKAATGLYIP